MVIKTIGFPSQLTDTEQAYVNLIIRTIAAVDPKSEVIITRKGAHVYPSSLDLRPDLITQLLKTHKQLNLKIIFSKSLSISKMISYELA